MGPCTQAAGLLLTSYRKFAGPRAAEGELELPEDQIERLLDSPTHRVSVVLVTYNRAALLNRTIEGLLHQTFADFELIIADDASPDETRQICEEWARRDGRVKYHRRPVNVKMPENLNLGILSSTGEYVAILHDDDIYRSDLLEKWSASLDEFPNAAFVFNTYPVLDKDGNVRLVVRMPLPRCSPGSVLLEEIYFKRWRLNSPVWGCAMIRRSALDRVGLFDARYGFWADVAMWMRLAEEFDVCYVDEPLITITSRLVAPHQFDDRAARTLAAADAMFWEARMRHYRDRPIRKIGEGVRHLAFVWALSGMNVASRINHFLRPNRRSNRR